MKMHRGCESANSFGGMTHPRLTAPLRNILENASAMSTYDHGDMVSLTEKAVVELECELGIAGAQNGSLAQCPTADLIRDFTVPNFIAKHANTPVAISP